MERRRLSPGRVCRTSVRAGPTFAVGRTSIEPWSLRWSLGLRRRSFFFFSSFFFSSFFFRLPHLQLHLHVHLLLRFSDSSRRTLMHPLGPALARSGTH